MHFKLAAAALALTAAVAGCGGDADETGAGDGAGASRGQDAPADASVEEFCTAFEETQMIAGDEAADILMDTGTPADMPEDARRGFEYLIDHPEGGQDVIDNKDVGTYVTYGSKTCADLINDKG